MLLSIDAGNTRTKWTLFDSAGEAISQGVCQNENLADAQFLPPKHICQHAIVANVAGDQHAAALSTQLSKQSIQNVHWALASPRACDVINSYEKPETLGIDRWAALVASWHLEKNICVVVNAGTAVTIDALGFQVENDQKMGLFKGGIILPGLQLLHQSLNTATAQLPLLEVSQQKALQRDIFAKNTADAIHAGALHAISGAITLMCHSMNAIYKSRPRVFLSGGNAHLIKENLIADVTRQAVVVDNLILQGLYLIEKNT